MQGLADGGHIYVTYPVFDSAKGWLADRPSLGWARHGFYALKGISEPIEIVEVYDGRYVTPKPPKGGRKQRGLPGWSVVAVVFLLGIAAVIGVQYLRNTVFSPKPQVYFHDLRDTVVAIDAMFPLLLDETGTADTYELQNDLSPGRYGLWFVLNRSLYLHTFEVQPGENRINPQYERYELPLYSARFDLDEPGAQGTDQQEFPVTLFDAEWNEVPGEFDIRVELERQDQADVTGPDGEGGFSFVGELVVRHPEGETRVPIDMLQDYSPADKWGEYEVIHEGDRYSLEYKYSAFRSSIEIEVAGYYPRP